MDQGVRDHLRAFYDGETPERVGRPLTEERADTRDAFIHELAVRGARSVLEVGCGPGRDGAALAAAGVAYTGIDLSPVAVRMCREQGLAAREADATALPFADDSVDAVWSMSTLMHLPGDGFVSPDPDLEGVRFVFHRCTVEYGHRGEQVASRAG